MTTVIAREETRCRHIDYSFRLAARVVLYASSHRQDNTYHGGALDGRRNSSMGPPWRIDPTTHRTMSERSYHGATYRYRREKTRCRHMGYSFRLAVSVLLYASSHRQDNTYHGLCYTSRGALTGTRNSTMKDRSDDPLYHKRTLLPQSYISLPYIYINKNIRNIPRVLQVVVFYLCTKWTLSVFLKQCSFTSSQVRLKSLT